MIRRTLRAGALSCEITLAGGVLTRVALPDPAPAAIAPRDLDLLLRQLHRLPVALAGTAFQQTVWQALRGIPPGRTRTYSEIARICGRPRAHRAVGRACGTNPLLLVVPCHRVAAAAGPGGFSAGLDWKQRLLAAEAAAASAPLPRAA